MYNSFAFCFSQDVNNEAAEELRKELDRVYRLKAINDQQLIEAKNRLAELEKQINEVSLEYVFNPSKQSSLLLYFLYLLLDEINNMQKFWSWRKN